MSTHKSAECPLYAMPEFERLFPLAIDFNGVLVRQSPLAVRNLAKRALAHPADYQALPWRLRAQIELVAQQVKESRFAQQLQDLSTAAAQSAGENVAHPAGGQK